MEAAPGSDDAGSGYAGVVRALAVERGGVGGSLWKKKGSVDVHSRARAAAASAGLTRANSTVSAFQICSTTITATTFSALGGEESNGAPSGPCPATVQFVLSMLHWVSGVDGKKGFAAAVCALARNARATFFELPHVRATGTYGEKRYAGWYAGLNSTTAALREAVATCNGDGNLRIELLGGTPWGPAKLNMTRDIQVVWNRGAASLSKATQSDATCAAALRCAP